MNKTATRGRPRTLPEEEGGYEYVSVALSKSDRTDLEDWAWRLRKPKAVLMRELIQKGLRLYRDSLDLQDKYPKPPPAPQPGG